MLSQFLKINQGRLLVGTMNFEYNEVSDWRQ